MRRSGWALAAAATAIGAARFALRARAPDDWDAIGFVRAIDDFDLQKFQPHFPGYPVYVALARAAHRGLGLAPLDAAAAVSAAAAGAAGLGVFYIARRASGRWGAASALALFGAASLPWLLGGAALSDETAAAFAVLAFAALAAARPRAGVGAALIGLMLGTRLSYWPLAASWVALLFWIDRRAWRAAALGGALGAFAWLVPFVAVVGAAKLWALGRAQLVGHFTAWGGSIATRPGLALRAGAFARDLFYDGLAPRVWALSGVALLVALLVAFGRSRPSGRALKVALVAAGPYALWVFFAQNIVEQPRHLLPLVIAAAIALGAAAGGHRALALALPSLVLAASLPLAWAHAHTLPAAAQAAAWAAREFPRGDAAVFGARSVRFFEGAPNLPAYPAGWLSEVDVALERLDSLPAHVLVTSELEADPRRARRLTDGPTFCRDPRLDRAQPCLTLREYHVGGRP